MPQSYSLGWHTWWLQQGYKHKKTFALARKVSCYNKSMTKQFLKDAFDRGKIFKVDLQNPILYRDAKQYGISFGIPEYQVDFAPDGKIWER